MKNIEYAVVIFLFMLSAVPFYLVRKKAKEVNAKSATCPKCKKPVVQEGETIKCTNDKCGLIYPIRDGIPVMLIEEAEPSRNSPE